MAERQILSEGNPDTILLTDFSKREEVQQTYFYVTQILISLLFIIEKRSSALRGCNSISSIYCYLTIAVVRELGVN